MNRKVLLLNADGLPNRIINWESAIIRLLRDSVVVVEESNTVIRSQYLSINLPSVIMLKKYKSIKNKTVMANKELVFLRDGCTCQYCGKKFDMAKLQLEHVLPKSKGGKKTMDNIVTSCKPCNDKKANKTPEQAGMTLIKNPKSMSFLESICISINNKYPEWKKYSVLD